MVETRLSLIVSVIAFLSLGASSAANGIEVRVGLFSIFHPGKIFVSSPAKGSLLEISFKKSNGAEGKFDSPEAFLACSKSRGLTIGVGKKRIHASSLRIKSSNSKEKVLVGVVGKQHKRAYSGSLEVHEKGGVCIVTNLVALENYVSSVSCHEIRGGLAEALKAQSVLVRTWALTHLKRHGKDSQDFCDLTHCQVYKGASACNESQLEELSKVRGMVLKYGSVLADVAYFSTCGGFTASARDIWGRNSDRKYLRGVEDGDPPYCSVSPHFRWHLILPRSEVCRVLEKKKTKGSDCTVEIAQTGKGAWVKSVRVVSGKEFYMSGEKFRMIMGRSFGWGKFKSANFHMSVDQDKIEFLGKGLGHGVGMCQYGAMTMAKRGMSFVDILRHYFPHTKIVELR